MRQLLAVSLGVEEEEAAALMMATAPSQVVLAVPALMTAAVALTVLMTAAVAPPALMTAPVVPPVLPVLTMTMVAALVVVMAAAPVPLPRGRLRRREAYILHLSKISVEDSCMVLTKWALLERISKGRRVAVRMNKI